MAGGYEFALWCLLLAACITDLVVGKIFNALTLPFLVGGILVRAFHGGVPQVEAAFLSIFTAVFLFFPLYWLKVFTAGDVKLLMAVGAWTEQKFLFQLALNTIVIGSLVGAFILVWQKRSGTPGNGETQTSGTKMPFAPAFVCAFVLLRIAELKGWSLA